MLVDLLVVLLGALAVGTGLLLGAFVALGPVMAPRILAQGEARLRDELLELGFAEHDGVFTSTVDGVRVKVRHGFDDKGGVIDVVARGLPEATSFGHREALRFRPRFTGPARGQPLRTPAVRRAVDDLAPLGELEAWEGMVSLSAPVGLRWLGADVVHQVAAFVRLLQQQGLPPLDDTLRDAPDGQQHDVPIYAAERDAKHGTEEAVELARLLLQAPRLPEGVHERCVFLAQDGPWRRDLCVSAWHPLAVRLKALEANTRRSPRMRSGASSTKAEQPRRNAWWGQNAWWGPERMEGSERKRLPL